MRVPPGRAGRLRLLRWLATARRASDLLTRKLRLLHLEEDRLDLLVEHTGTEWRRACAAADLWTVRAGVLGGQRALRLARSSTDATVNVAWTTTMGIRYPAAADVHPGEPGPLLVGTAALLEARAAHVRAVEAAGTYAAANSALRMVRAEMAATRTRLRALDDRSIPRIERTLRELEHSIDEVEHADAARLRRAVIAGRRL